MPIIRICVPACDAARSRSPNAGPSVGQFGAQEEGTSSKRRSAVTSSRSAVMKARNCFWCTAGGLVRRVDIIEIVDGDGQGVAGGRGGCIWDEAGFQEQTGEQAGVGACVQHG